MQTEDAYSCEEEADGPVYKSSDLLDDCGYDQANVSADPADKAHQCGEFDVKCIDENHSLRQISNSDVVCKDYNKPFIMVCIYCERPCCTCCIAKQHGGYSFMTIDDAAKDARSHLVASIEKQTTKTLTKLEYTQRASAEGLDQYKRSMQIAKNKSKESFVTLHKQLEQMEKEWIQRLKMMEAGDIKKMKAFHDITVNQLRSKKRYIDSCKGTHTNVSDLEAILLSSGM